MLSQCARIWSRSCSVVIRSIPAAPLLRLTASQAAVAFSRLTTCSISSSYIAFFGDFRKRRSLSSTPQRLRRLHRSGPRWPVRGGDRSCRAPPFRTTHRFASSSSFSFVLSFFGPSLGPAFTALSSLLWPLLTSPGLSAERISLGQCLCLSSHAAEFYLMQFDDLRASLLLASSPLHPASLLVRVPAAKTFASGSFGLRLAASA